MAIKFDIVLTQVRFHAALAVDAGMQVGARNVNENVISFTLSD